METESHSIEQGRFYVASRRCSTEIRRYLESQELQLLNIGSRKFFAYAASR